MSCPVLNPDDNHHEESFEREREILAVVEGELDFPFESDAMRLDIDSIDFEVESLFPSWTPVVFSKGNQCIPLESCHSLQKDLTSLRRQQFH
jgi:hypothetical protein